MQKLRNLWKPSREQQPSTILQITQNFFSTSFRRQNNNSKPQTTMEFDQYLTSLPKQYTQRPKNMKKKRNKTSSYSLKPQLLKKCYEILDPKYLDIAYEIQVGLFERNRYVLLQRQNSMHQQLDQVQICLFNQMSARFDEIMSVLLTIRSLECIVVQNQGRLGEIRHIFMVKMKKVTQKQIKGAKLSLKKQKIQKTIEILKHLKKYRKFMQLSSPEYHYNQTQTKQLSSSTNSLSISAKKSFEQNNQDNYSRQQLATNLQDNIQLFKSLKCSQNIEDKLEAHDEDIRQNFSHELNTKIYQYSCQYFKQNDKAYENDQYSQKIWAKFNKSRNIWEESNNGDSSFNSSMLDDSVMDGDIDDLTRRQIKLTIDNNAEEAILSSLNTCWTQGEFDASGLKSLFSTYLKNIHQQFITDFRVYCDSLCKQNKRIVDNPSLPNLLKLFSIQFCVKIYTYFLNFHKNILLRTFSLSKKLINLAIKKSIKQQLTIQHRYKLSILVEGAIDICSYLLRIVISKLCDIIQLKRIHQGIDILQFKNMIGVLEYFEEFINHNLLVLITEEIKCQEQSFLFELLNSAKDKLPLGMLHSQKMEKVQKYLNRLHKNSIQQELKQSLQDQVWNPTDIPTFYYDSLHFLMTGESLNLRRNRNHYKQGQSVNFGLETSVLGDINNDSFMIMNNKSKITTKIIADFRIIRNEIIIKNKKYKVTQTILLLVQIIQDYVLLAKTFPQIKKQVGIKLIELLRSYNASSTQLIIFKGALSLGKIKTKNITTKHLSLSSLCISFLLVLLECSPIKSLINELTQDYTKLIQSLTEHTQTITTKLYQILIHKVSSLQPTISFTEADKQIPTKGTQQMIYNMKIMYEILQQYFDEYTLKKIFTDELLGLYLQAIRSNSLGIKSRVDAQGLKDDVHYFFSQIKVIELTKLIPKDNIDKYRIAAQEVLKNIFQALI